MQKDPELFYDGVFEGLPAYQGEKISLFWEADVVSPTDNFVLSSIDWGDGTINGPDNKTFFLLGLGNGVLHFEDVECQHSYVAAGTYTVKFHLQDEGDFTHAPRSFDDTETLKINTFRVPIFTASPAGNQLPGQPLVGGGLLPGDNSPVTVVVRNAAGVADPTFNGGVSLALTDPNNTGATLTGNHVNASAGVATFSNLMVNGKGFGYSLTPSIDGETDVDGTGYPSNNFNVEPHQLLFNPQPAGGAIGQPMDVKVNVDLPLPSGGPFFDESFFGNVQIALQGGPSGASLVDDSGNPVSNLTVQASAGIADFKDVRINKAGQYTLVATLPGEVSAISGTSDQFGILGHTLKFDSPPTQGTAGDPLDDINVEADLSNSVDTAFDGTIQLTVAGGPAGVALVDSNGKPLTDGITLSANQGTVDFKGVRVNKAGQVTLEATITSEFNKPSTTSGPITLAGHTIVIATAPQGGAPAEILKPKPVVVKVEDAQGNLDTQYAGNVTLSLGDLNHTGATLGNAVAAVSNGQAEFNLLTIDFAGKYTVTAQADDRSQSDASQQFTVEHQLSFLTPPPQTVTVNEPIGAPLDASGNPTHPIQVQVKDSLGNVDTEFNGKAILSANGVQLAAVVFNNGLATFTNVRFGQISQNNTISVSLADGATTGASSPISVTKHDLGYSQQPPDPNAQPPASNHAIVGQAISPTVELEAFDVTGSLDTSFAGSVVLTLTTNPSQATLSGGTVNAVAGKADFTSLSVNKAGNGYELTAALPDEGEQVVSHLFNAVADAVKIVSFPSVGAIDESLPRVEVDVLGPDGQVDTGYNGQVTMTLAKGPLGGTLAAGQSANAQSGVADFDNLRVDTLGDYQLQASIVGSSPDAASRTGTISAKPHLISFLSTPSTGLAGEAMQAPVQVQVEYADGTLDPNFTNSITLSLQGGAPGAVVSSSKQNNSNGVVTLQDVSINKLGNYTLTANTGIVGDQPSGPSSTISIVPHQLEFGNIADAVVGEAFAVQVKVLDNNGNLDPNFTGAVTISIAGGTPGAVLGGGTAGTSGGQANFNATIDKPGLYTLSAAIDEGTTAGSNAFNVRGGQASGDTGFVSQVYQDLLHRPVDQASLQFWLNFLNNGGTAAQVATSVATSTENRRDQVDQAFDTLLHRPADADGETAFVVFLSAGGTIEQVDAAIAGSDEFFHQAGGTPDGFADALFLDFLHRSPDPGGLAWVEQSLAAGATRSEIAYQVLTSTEYKTGVIQNDFQTLLHRSADPLGLQAFLNAATAGVTDDDIAAAIAASAEYLKQFSA